MRLTQGIRCAGQFVIILAVLLHSFVTMAPIVSAADDDEPKLTLEGMKWQDVLGDKWSLIRNESEVMTPIKPGSYISTSGPFSGGQAVKWILRPIGAKNSNTMIRVEILWSQDTKALTDYKDKWFSNLAAIQKDQEDDSPKPSVIASQADKDRMLLITRKAFPAPSNDSILDGELVLSLPPNAFILIMGIRLESYFDEKTVVAMFASIEKLARDMLNPISMTLRHFHPFDEAVQEPGSLHRGGDIVVSVKKDGKPLANETVYLFLNMPLSDKSFFLYFRLPRVPDYPVAFLSDPATEQFAAMYASLKTDGNGEAAFNYIANDCFDPSLMTSRLNGLNGSPIVLTITAVIFAKDPKLSNEVVHTDIPSVIASENIELSFNSIARIKKISNVDNLEESVLLRRPNSPEVKITSADIGGRNKAEKDVPGGYGYALREEDSIILTQGDEINIQWLNGTSILFKAKSTKDWDWAANPEAKVYIGLMDAGWRAYFSGGISYLKGLAFGFSGCAVGIISYKIAPALAVVDFGLAIIGLIPLGYGAIDYMTNPLIVEYRSVILIETTVQNGRMDTNLYTLEGQATLHDPTDQGTVAVKTGEKIIVSSEGNFGQVTAYEESELSPDTAFLAKEMQYLLPAVKSTADTQTSENPSSGSGTSQAASDIPDSDKDTAGDSATDSTKGTASDSTVNSAGDSAKNSAADSVEGPIDKSSKNPESGSGQIRFLWLLIGAPVLLTALALFILIQRKRRKLAPALIKPLPSILSQPVLPVFQAGQDIQPRMAAGYFCTKCGTPNQVGDRYCSTCGAMLPSPLPARDIPDLPPFIYCSQCGAYIQRGKKYCSRCGNALL